MRKLNKILTLVITISFFLTSMSAIRTQSQEDDSRQLEISLSYTFETPIINTFYQDGESYSHVSLNGCGSNGAPGCPSLPIQPVKALLPPGTTITSVQVEATGKSTMKINNNMELGETTYYITSEPRLKMRINPDGSKTYSGFDDDNSKDDEESEESYYDENNIYPEELYNDFDVQYKRGFPVWVGSVNPVQYESTTKTLTYYESMELKIDLERSSYTHHSLYRGFERDKNLIADLVDNPSMVSSYGAPGIIDIDNPPKPQPEPKPTISFNPGPFDFGDLREGIGIISMKSFKIRAVGPSYQAKYSVNEDCSWLSLDIIDPESDNGKGCLRGSRDYEIIQITVDTTDLELGYYSYEFTINTENSQFDESYDVPVSLIVSDEKMVIITTEALKNMGGDYNLQALRAEHESRGLTVEIKPVEEIYAEFGDTVERIPIPDFFVERGYHPKALAPQYLQDYVVPEPYKSVWAPGGWKWSHVAIFDPTRIGNTIFYNDAYYNTEIIRNYIKHAYKNEGVDYVLLAGRDSKVWDQMVYVRYPYKSGDFPDINYVPVPQLFWTTILVMHLDTGTGFEPDAPIVSDDAGSNNVICDNINLVPDLSNGFDMEHGSFQIVSDYNEIESLINSYYTPEEPASTDQNDEPKGECFTWIYKMYAGADGYYACLDGSRDPFHGFFIPLNSGFGGPRDPRTTGYWFTDFLGEVSVGRASIRDEQDLHNFVKKTITQMNSPIDQPRDVVLVGEPLGFGLGAGAHLNELIGQSNANGWSTSGISTNNNIQKLYSSENGDDDWDKNTLINRINSGQADIIDHIGHGNYKKVMKMTKEDAPDITNTDSPSLLYYSQSCFSAAYDYGIDAMDLIKKYYRWLREEQDGLPPRDRKLPDEAVSWSDDCIAEYLCVKTDASSVAYIGNSYFGWGLTDSTDGPSQAFNREFWDAIEGEKMTRIGDANQDSKEDNIHRILSSRAFATGCPIYASLAYGINLLGDPAGLKIGNNPPVADAGDEYHGFVGEPVYFVDDSYDLDGGIVSREWDFGDGTLLNDANYQNLMHVYSEVGEYKVTLKVTDDNGAIDETIITVNIHELTGSGDPTDDDDDDSTDDDDSSGNNDDDSGPDEKPKTKLELIRDLISRLFRGEIPPREFFPVLLKIIFQ